VHQPGVGFPSASTVVCAHTWVGILKLHVGLAQVLLILSAMVFHRQCKHWKIGKSRKMGTVVNSRSIRYDRANFQNLRSRGSGKYWWHRESVPLHVKVGGTSSACAVSIPNSWQAPPCVNHPGPVDWYIFRTRTILPKVNFDSNGGATLESFSNREKHAACKGPEERAGSVLFTQKTS
jgi:hypothetical protein